MPINVSALAGFRGASSWNEDAVANLSGGGIASHGLYEGRLKAAFSKRGQDVKAANNAVRTALLTALGNAFGLEQAMGDGDRFSNEFMSRLQQLLGKDFKRSGFGIDANGRVNSGKPLTARRINAILARVDAAKANGLVDDAITYITGAEGFVQKARPYATFPFNKSELKLAADLVAQHGAGLSDDCQRILARYVVTAISRTKYDEKGSAAIKAEVGEMARKLAESIKSAKTFDVEDHEMAEFDAKLTAYWQDALADKMKNDQNYVRHGVFNRFMTVGDNDKYTIQGPKYEKRFDAIQQLKSVVKNSAHRKAITTVMSQRMRGFMVQNLSSGGTLPNTTNFTDLSLKSVKGGEHLLSVDNADGTFEEGLVKERNAEVNLRIVGKTATVVVKSHGDIRLNITDANEWSDIPIGTCNYEARFEFDLSDENEAKLTSVHLGQTIEA